MKTAPPVLVLAVLAALVAPVSAQDTGDRDERARTFFLHHQYPEALAIYSRLYAESLHPTFLRNMARCYQMMRQPDQAIANFRAYLRDARDLEAAERSEIEGYIAEMQRLQSPPDEGAPPAAGTSKRKVWVWSAIGLAVLGGVVAAVALGSGHAQRLPCPPGTTCP